MNTKDSAFGSNLLWIYKDAEKEHFPEEAGLRKVGELDDAGLSSSSYPRQRDYTTDEDRKMSGIFAA